MLILASRSPYRRAQLEQLGLTFCAVPSGVDEAAIQAESDPPDRLALRLAEEKARAVQASHPGDLVLAGDQLVSVDGAILGKPMTEAAAVEQLTRLSGRRHVLLTAVVLLGQGRVQSHLDRALMSMRPLDEAALRRYVARDQPLDCAGAYKYESAGIALFQKVEVQDPSAIIGLPLMAVVRMLEAEGIGVP